MLKIFKRIITMILTITIVITTNLSGMDFGRNVNNVFARTRYNSLSNLLTELNALPKKFETRYREGDGKMYSRQITIDSVSNPEYLMNWDVYGRLVDLAGEVPQVQSWIYFPQSEYQVIQFQIKLTMKKTCTTDSFVVSQNQYSLYGIALIDVNKGCFNTPHNEIYLNQYKAPKMTKENIRVTGDWVWEAGWYEDSSRMYNVGPFDDYVYSFGRMGSLKYTSHIYDSSTGLQEYNYDDSMIKIEDDFNANYSGSYSPVRNIRTTYNAPNRNGANGSFNTLCYCSNFRDASFDGFDMDLAKTSLALATASMGTNDSNIKKVATEQLAFKDFESFKYGNQFFSEKNNTVAYSLAHKNYYEHYENDEGFNVLMVSIRSGGYGGEWYSNGQLGMGNQHEGFYNAAKDVSQKIREYMDYYKLNSNTVVWISGFSRGGAVSNILAKELLDNGIVQERNIRCYTFATPRTTKTPVGIRGVYNIIDPIDIVTKVPFAQWGYGRNGQDIVLPLSKKNNVYKYLLPYTKDGYKQLTGDNYPIYYNENVILDKMCETLSKGFGNANNYASKYQNDLSMALYTALGQSKWFDVARNSSLIFTELTKIWLKLIRDGKFWESLGMVGAMESLIMNMGGAVWLPAFNLTHHDPELYMQWLNTGVVRENKTYVFSADCDLNLKSKIEELELKDNLDDAISELYNEIQITLNSKQINQKSMADNSANESVIEIKDESGNKVADIKGDDPYSFGENNPDLALGSYIDNNNTIHILVPADETYDVQISGKGTYNYSVSRFSENSNGDRNLIKKLVYNDISLSDEDNLCAKLNKGNADISESCKLSVNDNDIKPELELHENDSFDISVSEQGNGSVIGSGKFLYGDSVVLYASPLSDDSEFLGWYEDGECISTDKTFGFMATEERNIIAKFTEGNTQKETTNSKQVETTDKQKSEKKTSNNSVNNRPKRAIIKKVRKLSAKKIKIKIKRINNIAGYQICIYKTMKNAKKDKKKLYNKFFTNKKKATYILKIGKKKLNKKIFVKVRAYVISNNKKVFGSWSKIYKKGA